LLARTEKTAAPQMKAFSLSRPRSNSFFALFQKLHSMPEQFILLHVWSLSRAAVKFSDLYSNSFSGLGAMIQWWTLVHGHFNQDDTI